MRYHELVSSFSLGRGEGDAAYQLHFSDDYGCGYGARLLNLGDGFTVGYRYFGELLLDRPFPYGGLFSPETRT